MESDFPDYYRGQVAKSENISAVEPSVQNNKIGVASKKQTRYNLNNLSSEQRNIILEFEKYTGFKSEQYLAELEKRGVLGDE